VTLETIAEAQHDKAEHNTQQRCTRNLSLIASCETISAQESDTFGETRIGSQYSCGLTAAKTA
jgi:hypothetical protein